jgi:hypothetical protein
MQQNVSHDLSVVDSQWTGFLHIHLPVVLCVMYILWFGAFLQLPIYTLNFHVIYVSSYKFRIIHFI